jgi:phospholipase C
MGSGQIQHVFVLMLENRSFDHMLGFSGLTGADASTGAATKINGLSGSESNVYNAQAFSVSPGAPDRMVVDPGHEFSNVLLQLCGPGASYPSGGAYPSINNSGYVASYADGDGASNPGVLMNCYSPTQLPVLHALAAEFVVCDNWHASMPGPTWPNRMFVHAADSITALALRKSRTGRLLPDSLFRTAPSSTRCIKKVLHAVFTVAMTFRWFQR